jgi:indolepyruvate ferredoxin oxidoreductase
MSEIDIRRFSVPEMPEVRYLPVKGALALSFLLQRERDRLAGLRTAGVITGYQGSPLGDFERIYQTLKKLGILDKANIVFHPGLNESQAAGHVGGTQQIHLLSKAIYQGAFGVWYAKGPGLNYASDMISHINAAGMSPFGGCLYIVGDDLAGASSTIIESSEYLFIHMGMPILAPASPQDALDYPLYGIALSRFSGAAVGFKVPTDLAEASSDVIVDPAMKIVIPSMSGKDVHIRRGSKPGEHEKAKEERLKLAKIFADENDLNRVAHDAPEANLCIAAVGRSYAEVMEALSRLGIDDAKRQKLGIVVCKIGMPWPLSSDSSAMRRIRRSSRVLVVEEKAPIVEDQIKSLFYDDSCPHKPLVYGKSRIPGGATLPAVGVHTISQIAKAIVMSLCAYQRIDDDLSKVLKELARSDMLARAPAVSDTIRTPHTCSGCPHSRSLKNPEGAEARSGIGCHYMAEWMDPSRRAEFVTSMGGEGSTALVHLLLSDLTHLYQNLGDGTYSHSGSLAVRAAVAWMKQIPEKGITYMLLYNDAVAMTGGQVVEGGFTVQQIASQLRAEGVEMINVVAEDPKRYGRRPDFPEGVRVYSRDDLDEVKASMQKVRGVSVLIYDQVCAAEKRRRRKRGTYPQPTDRVFINPRVCEGCGDCSIKSNCPSVVPLSTKFGTKRQIDQSSCNVDYSCMSGFCPSFVKVKGLLPSHSRDRAQSLAKRSVPDPVLPTISEGYNIPLYGIGGTGVATMDAVLGMAAHLCGLHASGLSLTGLSQKGGAVECHVRISNERIHSTRIPPGTVDVMIAFDLVTATSPESLASLKLGRSHVVVNLQETPTADFIHDPQKVFPKEKMLAALKSAVGADHVHGIEAGSYATELFGDSIAANMFLVGYAYQLGLIPIRADAIREAIRLNNVSVSMNLDAFACGRYAAAFPSEFESLGWQWKDEFEKNRKPFSIEDGVRELTAYQGRAYADRYLELVRDAQALDLHHGRAESPLLTEAVIRYFYKLLAYKDEYEVARLYTDGEFERKLKRVFGDDHGAVSHSLAPPSLGTKKKMFGPWMFTAMRVLAKFKWLRGTWLDPFGYSAHRKEERELIRQYESLIAEMGYGLNADNYDLAVQLLSIPEEIRGYGHIKQASIEKAKKKAEGLLRLFCEKVKMT